MTPLMRKYNHFQRLARTERIGIGFFFFGLFIGALAVGGLENTTAVFVPVASAIISLVAMIYGGTMVIAAQAKIKADPDFRSWWKDENEKGSPLLERTVFRKTTV